VPARSPAARTYNPCAVAAVLVTMPVGPIGLAHHALGQFKESILMPLRHRRVTQPSYLGRELSHVTGQLLQLIHVKTKSLDGRPWQPGRYQAGSRVAKPQTFTAPRSRVTAMGWPC
jgi:hypothetical protein